MAIWGSFTFMIALFSTVPFLFFPMVWGCVFFVTRKPDKATKWSIDITTLLLIFSTAVLFDNVAGSRVIFWLLVMLMLIGAGLLGNMQNRLKGKVDPLKIFRVVWRGGFLVFSLVYVILLFIGIGQQWFEG